jgi:hypothetical protein
VKLDTKPGDKVRFLNEGGYAQERLIANDRMTPGQTYTVEEVQVGFWHSVITLEGVQGWHNTVMFENVEAPDVL